jgi:hypothetical protein
MHAELRFWEAMDALLRCSPATVQPAELFPLFPDVMRPWLDAAHTSKLATAGANSNNHNGAVSPQVLQSICQ